MNKIPVPKQPLPRPQFDSNDYELIRRDRLSDGFFKLDRISLRHRLFEGGWSAEMQREVLVRNPAAGVLLYDPDLQKVVLVEQFRIGAIENSKGPWCLELVAGIADKDESVQELVKREALEEAGCEIKSLVAVHKYMASPGGSSESMELFCGKIDASSAGGIFGLVDENEDIKVHVLEVDALEVLLKEGKLNNAATLIAVQWLLLNREKILFT